MAQIGIINGNIGNGHHSEARSWTVTVTGKVTSVYDHLKTFGGPFNPDTPVKIATVRVKNNGTKDGTVYNAIAELNADGSIKDEFCRDSTTLAAGVCVAFGGAQHTRYCAVGDPDKECRSLGSVYIKKPPGTYYYGIKTWGEDESEPSYPSPTAAFGAAAAAGEEEKLCIPTTDICLSPIEWAAVAAAGVIAGVIGYAGVKAAKGQRIF